jgi:hypothetical protein
MIATISGLVVKIVGDPITAVTTPKLENVLEDMEDFVDDVFDDLGDTLEDMHLWKK